MKIFLSPSFADRNRNRLNISYYVIDTLGGWVVLVI